MDKIDDGIAFGGGALLTAGKMVININWTLASEDIIVKSISVLIVGVIGGFAGMFGKYLFDKIFKKKP